MAVTEVVVAVEKTNQSGAPLNAQLLQSLCQRGFDLTVYQGALKVRAKTVFKHAAGKQTEKISGD